MGKWYNCSQAEAQDGYDSAKQKYANAAESYAQTTNKLNSCSSEYSAEKSRLDSASSEKLNFEKRIEQIEKIIKMLGEGSDVDDAIIDANSAAEKAEKSLSLSVKCSGVNSPSLSTAFKCRRVMEDPDTAAALSEFKKEKSNLEQSVAQVESQIKAMEENVENLTKQMNSLTSAQSAARKAMNSSAYEMNHYKKYM